MVLKADVRILVIDDDPLVARVMAEALQSEGNDVVVARGGAEGLRAIEENRPDGVFLDIAMPGMDGIEILRRIRGRHANLPVIILTGWASERQIELTGIALLPEGVDEGSEALAQLVPESHEEQRQAVRLPSPHKGRGRNGRLAVRRR